MAGARPVVTIYLPTREALGTGPGNCMHAPQPALLSWAGLLRDGVHALLGTNASVSSSEKRLLERCRRSSQAAGGLGPCPVGRPSVCSINFAWVSPTGMDPRRELLRGYVEGEGRGEGAAIRMQHFLDGSDRSRCSARRVVSGAHGSIDTPLPQEDTYGASLPPLETLVANSVSSGFSGWVLLWCSQQLAAACVGRSAVPSKYEGENGYKDRMPS